MSETACIITAFFNYDYEIRIKYLEENLKKNGYKVIIVSSNWDHRKKIRYENSKENLLLLSVTQYKNNLSILRIISHFVFSYKAYKFCKIIKPELVYVITPPNFLFYFLNKYKKYNNKTKLIYEIEDMWPETMPLGKIAKYFFSPFSYFWKKLRDKYILNSDDIVFECNYFRNYLINLIEKDKIKLPRIHTVYLTRKDTIYYIKKEYYSNSINILYLGSINNLIDIDLILKLLVDINKNKKVTLNIIGDGENAENLIAGLRKNNINYINHGIVYDEKNKSNIMNKCHFALNIMKESVFVGITMKSLEYFCYGLPIINNIKGDTEVFVENYKCGFNLCNNIGRKIINLSKEEYLQMQNNSRRVYLNYFYPNIIDSYKFCNTNLEK